MDVEKNGKLLEGIEEGDNSDKDNVEHNGGSFRRGIVEIFIMYLDRCTMTGIPFIRNSENRVVKVAWSLLLFVAFFVMTGHLVLLFASYYQYSIHSKVVYTFNPLPFPAVTFCNVNAVRKSMKNHRPLSSTPFNYDFDYDIGGLNGVDINIPAIPAGKSENDLKMWESSAMFDDIFERVLKEINTSENKTGNTTIEESLNGRSSWHTLVTRFRETFAYLDNNTRYEMGHQLSDMVIECYFNGYNCKQNCFRLTQSINFGNCFTLDCDDFSSFESGPDKGLTLILRMELNEYMSIMSESKGAVLVVHERNTIAFPSDDGIAISAGTDNLIGIRQIDIIRRQEPYGKCTPKKEFKKEFGVNPTRNTCLKVCRQKKIMAACNCYDNKLPTINILMNLSNVNNFCQLDNERDCVKMISANFSKQSDSCNCHNPCNETKFEKTVSTRKWPSDDFQKLLVSSVCLKSPAACKELKNNTAQLDEEFLKIQIYYEDLNYEVYSETPEYELTQFLSDVGGTIGLWIGLSILGVCEVLHLMIQLLIYLWSRPWPVTRRENPLSCC